MRQRRRKQAVRPKIQEGDPIRAFKAQITVEDVLNSRMIAYACRLPQCCLVTDGDAPGTEQEAGLPPRPRRDCREPDGGQTQDFTSSRAFRVAGPKAFAEAGIMHHEVDHLMIYDAFAHLPIYSLEDLGFVPRGEAGAFITERNIAPGGRLPLNTNGGGLSYMHSGMYGMYALQESVRQMRGTASAQVPGRPDLGLPRRYVRRKRHHHHGE